MPVGDEEAHQNTTFQSDIHPPQMRRRSAYDLGEAATQPNATPEFDEHAMDDMLESFYDNYMFDVPSDEHPNVMGSNRAGGGSIDMEEERMRTLARLPLFNCAMILVLRASLALLNLQYLFGWSDKSVDALLK